MKYFRAQLHLTQQELAVFLGISQSLLSMYEKNLRELPVQASLKLARLELELHQFQQQKAISDLKHALHQQKNMRKLETLLNRQARQAEWNLLRLSEALDKMKERQKQLDLKLAFIKRLMTPGSSWLEDKPLLQNMMLDAEAALDGCDVACQQRMTYQLLLLKSRIKIMRQAQETVRQLLKPETDGR
ncbi:helix-turn-helix transcriptional regulator [Niabella sp. CC-SYL272]|uniref:helix-turn-helix domain-containing protein n=1 Tax=Niabella agricola TaxID=2891571 RepID=UPI001F1CD503|nr:helix-turn-helix transcriptional regulator [Niabella agricola]MCF3110709.1 helix-turn-helix transcriptional regulator [Niabella agricola]